ncbi:NAD(P)-dependent dehydrogenase (short-subunit alcohol dehydrogenase family) [Dyadobacter sp. BE34]|nr:MULTISPECIES: SDR family oxidoreductase [Dyadobacter]MDR7198072.1 NAD(P)-dependent dehydrogenase (short-subunit alcohol dehydrogenase family) [Dyadobacter sp. BE34]
MARRWQSLTLSGHRRVRRYESRFGSLYQKLGQGFRRPKITVNIIQPGLIDTDMNPANGVFSTEMLKAVALGHYGEPQDIGAAAAFLSSFDVRYITGATLNVDGGQSA